MSDRLFQSAVADPSAPQPHGTVSPPGPAGATTAGPSRLRLALRGWLASTVAFAAGNELLENPWELVQLFVIGLFLLLYGLTPLTGGDKLGLVGADEPRYAQVAREMLAVHDANCTRLHADFVPHSPAVTDIRSSWNCLWGGTVTPILYGKPWLEKPALYYWRAMSFYREFGVSDWSARIPSTSGAALLGMLIYLHMKRFRPGGHLSAALITMSSVAIFAFARGASTDMQLAAPFCLGMLGWYGWYETGKKFWLFDLYFFGAAATLAKGPVAPFLALAIILLFVGLRKEWNLLRRTIWLPGILLYLVMVLPWYVAVQNVNPTFFRQFFLEHNLERFATNRYQHHQPVWYYVAVLVLGLMPWTGIAIRALIDACQISVAEWKVRRRGVPYLGSPRAGDAFPEFLVLWALVPIVFFSFSGSKLPGYILPSIPPLTILCGDYLYRIRRTGISNWLLWTHAGLCAVLVFVFTLAPQHMEYETLIPSWQWMAVAAAAALATMLLVAGGIRGFGINQTLNVTLIPVIGVLVFLLGFHGRDLDLNYSARPLAEEIARYAPNDQLVALVDVKRDMDFGLAFYRNRPMLHYERDGVPDAEHVLVTRTNDQAALDRYLSGRIYEPLFLYDTQGLSVYRVYAKPESTQAALTAAPGPRPQRSGLRTHHR